MNKFILAMMLFIGGAGQLNAGSRSGAIMAACAKLPSWGMQWFSQRSYSEQGLLVAVTGALSVGACYFGLKFAKNKRSINSCKSILAQEQLTYDGALARYRETTGTDFSLDGDAYQNELRYYKKVRSDLEKVNCFWVSEKTLADLRWRASVATLENARVAMESAIQQHGKKLKIAEFRKSYEVHRPAFKAHEEEDEKLLGDLLVAEKFVTTKVPGYNTPLGVGRGE